MKLTCCDCGKEYALKVVETEKGTPFVECPFCGLAHLLSFDRVEKGFDAPKKARDCENIKIGGYTAPLVGGARWLSPTRVDLSGSDDGYNYPGGVYAILAVSFYGSKGDYTFKPRLGARAEGGYAIYTVVSSTSNFLRIAGSGNTDLVDNTTVTSGNSRCTLQSGYTFEAVGKEMASIYEPTASIVLTDEYQCECQWAVQLHPGGANVAAHPFQIWEFQIWDSANSAEIAELTMTLDTPFPTPGKFGFGVDVEHVTDAGDTFADEYDDVDMWREWYTRTGTSLIIPYFDRSMADAFRAFITTSDYYQREHDYDLDLVDTYYNSRQDYNAGFAIYQGGYAWWDTTDEVIKRSQGRHPVGTRDTLAPTAGAPNQGMVFRSEHVQIRDSTNTRINDHNFFTTTINNYFTDSLGHYDIGMDEDDNILSAVYDSGYVMRKHSGFSATISSSFTVNSAGYGVGASGNGNAMTVHTPSGGTRGIRRHTGWTTTIADYVEVSTAYQLADDQGRSAAIEILTSHDYRWVVSDVYAVGEDAKYLKIEKNLYRTGSGSPALWIRGTSNNNKFSPGASSPSWERLDWDTWSGDKSTWKNFQIKIELTTTTTA